MHLHSVMDVQVHVQTLVGEHAVEIVQEIVALRVKVLAKVLVIKVVVANVNFN